MKRWGEPQRSVLEASGHPGTLVLVILLCTLVAMLVGMLPA